MNKIYVLGAVLAITFSNAQSKSNLTKPNKNQNQKPFTSTYKASEIKFEQTADFNNGIVSQLDQNDAIVLSADDFELTEETKLDKLVFYGTQDYGDLPDFYLGLKVYIFSDDNGKPNGKPSNTSNAIAVINIDENSTSTVLTGAESEFKFEIDVTAALGGTALTLMPNTKYWVAFAPRVDLFEDFGVDPGETFYWSLGNGNFLEPMLIDEADLFEAGATNWSTISSLIGDAFDGLAFTITGESSLGTTEVYSNLRNVSIYPNPAVNVINLKSNKKNSITKTEIFDMNGKLVITSSETSINVEKLPKAVYVVKVYSGNEVIETSKMIKK